MVKSLSSLQNQKTTDPLFSKSLAEITKKNINFDLNTHSIAYGLSEWYCMGRKRIVYELLKINF